MLIASQIYTQDTTNTQSDAFRRNLPDGKSVLNRPKYRSYPLLTGFLLQQEANSGDPFAQHELGIRRLLGQGFAPDTAKAIYWIQKAADQNLTAAKFNYGIMLYNGIGGDWNPFKAFENFEFAALSGMPEGEYAYGICFTENFVVNRDMSAAYKWIKKAAEQDYEPAKKTLVQLNKLGFNLLDIDEKDTSDISTYDEESSKTTTAVMQQNWDFDYIEFEDDTVDSEKETEMVEELLRKDKDELNDALGISEIQDKSELKDTSALGLVEFAVRNGSPEALLIEGSAYEKGINVQKDLIEAAYRYLRSYRLGSQRAAMRLFQLTKAPDFFSQLKKKVDSGSPEAMYTWAGMIALGFDFQLTEEQAYELLEKAASMNHVQSIIEIGLNYYNGSLVKENKKKALEYWKRAADLGSREAKVRIAFADLSDSSSTNDFTSQVAILKDAASNGSVLAQTALAYCFENGIGVKQNKATAAELYRKASYRGNETAYNSLKRMYDEIRPGDDRYQIYE